MQITKRVIHSPGQGSGQSGPSLGRRIALPTASGFGPSEPSDATVLDPDGPTLHVFLQGKTADRKASTVFLVLLLRS